MKAKSCKLKSFLIVPAVLAVLLVYGSLCLVVFVDAAVIAKSKFADLSRGIFQTSSFSMLHSGGFYQLVCKRMQYTAHDPAQLDSFYRISILKNPSDSPAVISYAKYLFDKNCCPDRVAKLLIEGARRSPTTPSVNVEAAVLLFRVGAQAQAIEILRKSLAQKMSRPSRIYDQLDRLGVDFRIAEKITPRTKEGLLELTRYYAKKGDVAKLDWQKTILKIDETALKPDERLRIAEQAFRLGEWEIAKKNASAASRSNEVRKDCLRLLMDIAWNEKNGRELQAQANELEDYYRQKGAEDKATKVRKETDNRLATLARQKS